METETEARIMENGRPGWLIEHCGAGRGVHVTIGDPDRPMLTGDLPTDTARQMAADLLAAADRADAIWTEHGGDR